MVTIGRIVGSTFLAGIMAGFGVLASVLYVYEKWAWAVTSKALTWGKE